MPIRQDISTIDNEGVDIMNPTILAYHYPDSTIVSGSLLTGITGPGQATTGPALNDG